MYVRGHKQPLIYLKDSRPFSLVNLRGLRNNHLLHPGVYRLVSVFQLRDHAPLDNSLFYISLKRYTIDFRYHALIIVLVQQNAFFLETEHQCHLKMFRQRFSGFSRYRISVRIQHMALLIMCKRGQYRHDTLMDKRG